MKNKSTTQISELVDSFVSELSKIVHESALNVVREALGDDLIPAKRRGSRTRRKTSKASDNLRKASKAAISSKASNPHARRSSEELTAVGDVILKHVRENSGQRLEAIGEALGKSTKGLKRPITNLIAAGKLRTEGVKRGTRYFVARKTKK